MRNTSPTTHPAPATLACVNRLTVPKLSAIRPHSCRLSYYSPPARWATACGRVAHRVVLSNREVWRMAVDGGLGAELVVLGRYRGLGLDVIAH